jgi:hypothetical protein
MAHNRLSCAGEFVDSLARKIGPTTGSGASFVPRLYSDAGSVRAGWLGGGLCGDRPPNDCQSGESFHCFSVAARADLRSPGRAGWHTPANVWDTPTTWSASGRESHAKAGRLLPSEITVREAWERVHSGESRSSLVTDRRGVVGVKFVREQFFLAAAAQNIKRLARYLSQPTPLSTEAATSLR